LRRFDPAARSLLGQVYSQTGRDAEALEMYQGIVDRSPGDSLRLAEVAARLGKSAVARTSGEEALGGFQAILDRQRDSWPARQDVVRSLIFLERFEDSLQVLRETPAEVDRDLLRGALVSVYGTWTMVLQQQNAPVQRRIDIIEKTLRADPGSTLALDSIASLLQNADDAELIRIRAILNRMLVVGQSTPLVHLCLGTDAILREDFDAGIKHLRLAYQSDPNLVVAANNLAWALMQTQPPKLTEALQLVDSVVERQPELAAVRETRGQVLLRLGKVEQAIAELEYALRELPTSVVTRESLITAYRLAGMDAVAAEHELILKHINDQK
jgi:tetratricopeptide (TPR) repeat protein